MQTSRRVIHAIGLAVAGLVAGAGVARAQVTEADVGVNKTFEQTLGGVDFTGGFFPDAHSLTVRATSPEEL